MRPQAKAQRRGLVSGACSHRGGVSVLGDKQGNSIPPDRLPKGPRSRSLGSGPSSSAHVVGSPCSSGPRGAGWHVHTPSPCPQAIVHGARSSQDKAQLAF